MPRTLEARALRGPNLHSRSPCIALSLEVPDRDAAAAAATLRSCLDQLDAEAPEAATLPALAAAVGDALLRAAGCTPPGPVEGDGVFACADETTGLEAADQVAHLLDDGLAGRPLDVAAAVAEVRTTHETCGLGPSTGAIAAAARRRGIPVARVDEGSGLRLGHGRHQQRVQATMTGRTSAIAVEAADDKQFTKRILAGAGVPVPQGRTVRDAAEAVDAADALGYPVVVKPLVGNHGRGVRTGLAGPEAVREAFEAARAICRSVLVERQVTGDDFRILLVGDRIVAAARREPAQVVGDGVRTVEALVARANADPRRGDGHSRVLTRIVVDADTEAQLARQELTLESVPAAGRVVRLKGTANLSTGGTAHDVTDEMHPEVRRAMERASRAIGLDVVGFDVVAPHLRAPLHETGGCVVEANAAPGIRMHEQPSSGRARPAAEAIVAHLFPAGAPSRIPLVAITGGDGATEAAGLLARMLLATGNNVGHAGRDGVTVGGLPVHRGDFSGPEGADAVLGDPAVDAAVLEMAPDGILRHGLGFDACDVAVVVGGAGPAAGALARTVRSGVLLTAATPWEAARAAANALQLPPHAIEAACPLPQLAPTATTPQASGAASAPSL